jgi:16S rRNA (cytosine1402-N4)-methyltransferase
MQFQHLPVLAKETLELLDIKPGHTVVDTTAGGGGHLFLMAEAAGPSGTVIGIDRDPRALELDAAGKVKEAFKDRVQLVNAPFSELPNLLAKLGIRQVDRILCDLGVSSPQLDTEARGFSFMRDGPLDMRMSSDRGTTAYELIQQLSETELANIIYRYGEERFSRRIARVIKEKWPIADSTLALADVIAKAVGRREKIHPATRTFQALRIAVNDELGELISLINCLPQLLAPHGRAVFISFHSLEDRLIKHAFRKAAALSKSKSYRILTKRPIIAEDEEIKSNPRARSAKLRGLEKMGEEDLEGLLCEKTSSSSFASS